MVTCIGIDFDNTLARFLTSSTGFFEIFSPHRVPETQLKETYDAIAHSQQGKGFTFEEMLADVTKMVHTLSSHKEELKKAFGNWLRANLVLYPDSLSALTRWHNKLHIPVCIVTAGAEQYQRQKVQLLHIPHDDIIVVPHANEKASVTKMLLQRYGRRIVFIDDKESELDHLCEAGISTDDVLKVHINRPDSPYRDQVPKYKHLEVASLADKLLVNALK
ncbi:MAG: haloacid dehalogenase-like hydrolase [bacterium]|nr:haloacid dehalogenase-like hydrolase [bacterium]